ncbi:hypothetical protein SAMN06265360_11056 [Haloechinothrix alba]|uniref:Uncharacterized protein n=1 Tax=Haloechinothrix alba TaxID=664784 RepID=A0A238XBD0_9PSEU|nr:DUF5701 family protein [Haloechinothrix alba]SNR56257.1 hypothetical protein SAMN06265360_11056 [Haloechinothrix alba]
MSPGSFDPVDEFDRQTRTLIDKGYPAMTGLSAQALGELVDPLRAHVVDRAREMRPPTPARVPFVLVVTRKLVPTHRTITVTELGGRPGFADFDDADLERFEAIDGVDVPDREVYLVFDIERGPDTRNVAPRDAMPMITERGRSPLTIEEGIALVTQFPETLEKNNCFSLLASRCGDKRVPALWISKKAPKLGWCWNGNPHTWLGSASCAGRAG